MTEPARLIRTIDWRQAVMNVVAESREVWNDYNKRQEFEHDLINRKTTWWLTAQALLFAAYGVTLRPDAGPDALEFRLVIAASGVALAAITLVGVLAVILSKVLSWLEYLEHLDHACSRCAPADRARHRVAGPALSRRRTCLLESAWGRGQSFHPTGRAGRGGRRNTSVAPCCPCAARGNRPPDRPRTASGGGLRFAA